MTESWLGKPGATKIGPARVDFSPEGHFWRPWVGNFFTWSPMHRHEFRAFTRKGARLKADRAWSIAKAEIDRAPKRTAAGAG